MRPAASEPYVRFLFIIRPFSGLIDSIATGCWDPYGVPAIYKLFEGLAKRGYRLHILLLCKSRREARRLSKSKCVRFDHLNATFRILPFYGFGIQNSVISDALNEAVQSLLLFRHLLRRRYDLIYTDRSNIRYAMIGSMLCMRVVVRFLGIAQFKYYTDSIRDRITSPMNYLSLKKRYDLIVCTEDGSPARELFGKCLNKQTPYLILKNGVDPISRNRPSGCIRQKYGFSGETTIFLFIGRSDPNKGFREFISALHNLNSRQHPFYALMICGGSDYEEYEKRARALSLHNRLRFVGRVPHHQIEDYYRGSDVFVSLNKIGSMSNTVLEAINYHKCIIMLNEDATDHTDRSTHHLIPDDTVIKINRHHIVQDLTEKAIALIENRQLIQAYEKKIQAFSERFLWAWDQRIDYEIDLLVRIAQGKKYGMERRYDFKQCGI